jgi:predicted ester cyclase
MTTDNQASTTWDAATVAVAALHVMSSSSREEYDALFAPDAVNRESIDEPLDTRGTGPAAFFATSAWLRTAFSDLAWQVREVAGDGELVAIHASMSGRQTGPFVNHGPDGSVVATFPATGRRFAVTQSHWFRVKDGQVTEHWANRDDLGMGMQLGWGPPAASDPAMTTAALEPSGPGSDRAPHHA